tara:strand:+ start:3367 stop:3762 length:396 start_codon:yes stop_codon:yes gene_type:complete
MIWDDQKMEQMVKLRKSGLTAQETALVLGTTANTVYSKERRIRNGSTAHTKPKDGSNQRRYTSNEVGVSPREVTETYKVFLVTNTKTNTYYKISGMGHELPHKALKSTILGEERRMYSETAKALLVYERIM